MSKRTVTPFSTWHSRTSMYPWYACIQEKLRSGFRAGHCFVGWAFDSLEQTFRINQHEVPWMTVRTANHCLWFGNVLANSPRRVFENAPPKHGVVIEVAAGVGVGQQESGPGHRPGDGGGGGGCSCSGSCSCSSCSSSSSSSSSRGGGGGGGRS